MVVLGLPLLVVYARLRWTGFVADQFALFTGFAHVEALFLRLILFGTAPQCSTMS
jgi:hypothetical protein